MKPIKNPLNHSTETKKTSQRKFLAVGILCLGLLAGEGAAHRWLDRMIEGPDSHAVKLEKSLSTLPLRIGAWKGVEIPMDQRVIEVAGCDDHVNRRYTDASSGQSLILYVAYAARPARMISHRPQVCYPAQGWQPVNERKDHILMADSKKVDCLIHHFRKSDPERQAVVVLNYYILQGRYTTEWMDFWGPKWRMPNLMRDPNFYVIQVQISGMVSDLSLAERTEETIKNFAAEVVPSVEAFLPGTSK